MVNVLYGILKQVLEKIAPVNLVYIFFYGCESGDEISKKAAIY
jgi:hypothetical protein